MRNFTEIEASIKQCALSEPDLPLQKVLAIRLLLHSVSGYLEYNTPRKLDQKIAANKIE